MMSTLRYYVLVNRNNLYRFCASSVGIMTSGGHHFSPSRFDRVVFFQYGQKRPGLADCYPKIFCYIVSADSFPVIKHPFCNF